MSKKVEIKARPQLQPAAEKWVENRAGVKAAPAERLKRLTIDIPEELHTRFKMSCVSRKEEMAAAVRRLIERELEQGAR